MLWKKKKKIARRRRRRHHHRCDFISSRSFLTRRWPSKNAFALQLDCRRHAAPPDPRFGIAELLFATPSYDDLSIASWQSHNPTEAVAWQCSQKSSPEWGQSSNHVLSPQGVLGLVSVCDLILFYVERRARACPEPSFISSALDGKSMGTFFAAATAQTLSCLWRGHCDTINVYREPPNLLFACISQNVNQQSSLSSPQKNGEQRSSRAEERSLLTTFAVAAAAARLAGGQLGRSHNLGSRSVNLDSTTQATPPPLVRSAMSSAQPERQPLEKICWHPTAPHAAGVQKKNARDRGELFGKFCLFAC